MKTKIPIKKYIVDNTQSWEERYKKLDAHHKEETEFLIERISELELEIEELQNAELTSYCPHCGYESCRCQ